MIVDGHDLATIRDLSEYRRHEVGLVFQFHNLLPQLPALSNVEVAMFGGHRRARQRRARARELLAAVDIGDRAHRLPTELSGGERQRVAIARALANEPTGSLDSASTERFLNLLRHLGDTGMTVVLVTHDSEVAEHADRIIEIRDGAIVPDTTSLSKSRPQLDGRAETTYGLAWASGPPARRQPPGGVAGNQGGRYRPMRELVPAR